VDVAETILKSYAQGNPVTLEGLQATTAFDVTSIQQLLTDFGIPTRMIGNGQRDGEAPGGLKTIQTADKQDNGYHHGTMKVNKEETHGGAGVGQTNHTEVMDTGEVPQGNDSIVKEVMTNDDVSNDSYIKMTNVIMDDDGNCKAADDDGTTTANILLGEDDDDTIEEEEVIDDVEEEEEVMEVDAEDEETSSDSHEPLHVVHPAEDDRTTKLDGTLTISLAQPQKSSETAAASELICLDLDSSGEDNRVAGEAIGKTDANDTQQLQQGDNHFPRGYYEAAYLGVSNSSGDIKRTETVEICDGKQNMEVAAAADTASTDAPKKQPIPSAGVVAKSLRIPADVYLEKADGSMVEVQNLIFSLKGVFATGFGSSKPVYYHPRNSSSKVDTSCDPVTQIEATTATTTAAAFMCSCQTVERHFSCGI